MSDALEKSNLREPSAEVDRLANLVIGCAIEVHCHLGPGFAEDVYEEALCQELQLNNIVFQRQRSIAVFYKGKRVGEGRLDLLVADCLIVELKAVSALAPVHTAQVKAYLKATGLQLALLINFNVTLLREGIKRIILS